MPLSARLGKKKLKELLRTMDYDLAIGLLFELIENIEDRLDKLHEEVVALKGEIARCRRLID